MSTKAIHCRAWFVLALCGIQSPLPAQDKERDFRPRKLMSPLRAIVDAPTLPADRITDQVNDNELVIGLVINGNARAYPINMLTGPRREIINDTLGKRAIAATW